MAIIQVDKNNIDKEHICCAISEKKGENCVGSKKAWLTERFKEGLVFKKLDERGKVFIEYIPTENAWYPIEAPNMMHINCFWVSGKFKGQGYANKLFDECIEDAKRLGKDGITIISSKKKRAFLSDYKFLEYKGFSIVDSVEPYFELLYYPLNKDAKRPSFKDSVKTPDIKEKGWVLYYTNQCPHTEKYAPILKEFAESCGEEFTLKKIATTKEAQSCPSPFTTYSLFYDGEFVTQEILSEKRFTKILEEKKA